MSKRECCLHQAAPHERSSTLSALIGDHRATGHETGPLSAQDVRSARKNRGTRAVALAMAAAASLSTAVLAAGPAQAVSAHGWVDSQAVSIVLPFTAAEISALQELGDFLGANSRITADRYASGNAYR
jgi:hypothetical protein